MRQHGDQILVDVRELRQMQERESRWLAIADAANEVWLLSTHNADMLSGDSYWEEFDRLMDKLSTALKASPANSTGGQNDT